MTAANRRPVFRQPARLRIHDQCRSAVRRQSARYDFVSTANAIAGDLQVIVGVCGMARKVGSKPMKAIMAKMLELYGQLIEFLVFDERVILDSPVEQWPLCDCLISFYATDFPLDKAIRYARLRHPYVINNLEAQYDLLSRFASHSAS